LLHRHLSIAKAMLHTGLLTATLGVAAVAIWAGGNLSIGERAMVFAIGGVVIVLDALVVFMQVGRDFVLRSGQRIPLTVIPAQGGAAVATGAVQSEPPT
jgi:hypothetical protein